MSNKEQDHIVDTNKMVTAVEWLFNNYVDKGVITIEAIEQALEMEKQQIIRAHFDAQPFNATMLNNAEQYYKETYLQ